MAMVVVKLSKGGMASAFGNEKASVHRKKKKKEQKNRTSNLICEFDILLLYYQQQCANCCKFSSSSYTHTLLYTYPIINPIFIVAYILSSIEDAFLLFAFSSCSTCTA